MEGAMISGRDMAASVRGGLTCGRGRGNARRGGWGFLKS
jgi:hypothetical protein